MEDILHPIYTVVLVNDGIQVVALTVLANIFFQYFAIELIKRFLCKHSD